MRRPIAAMVALFLLTAVGCATPTSSTSSKHNIPPTAGAATVVDLDAPAPAEAAVIEKLEQHLAEVKLNAVRFDDALKRSCDGLTFRPRSSLQHHQ
jgi:hypothetical protein